VTENEYLEAVLRSQTLAPNGPELLELQRQREQVEKVINEKLGSAEPDVRMGGSKAKNTMIREAYDLDLPTYFAWDETGAGETLEDIYNTVADAMSGDYVVERRRSALRLRRKDPRRYQEDTHVDLVPGRFFDESRTDAWIYQNHAEKCRLKTNLAVHIDHIRDSGVRPAIRLGKLWNVRESVGMKTFVLELLIVDLLKRRKNAPLADQFRYVMEQFRDESDDLSVCDPANSNNDLTSALTAVKPQLVAAASNVLWRIDHQGWQAAFGPVQEEDRAQSIARAASTVATANQYKPWSSGR
jgi:hypothetical protein